MHMLPKKEGTTIADNCLHDITKHISYERKKNGTLTRWNMHFLIKATKEA